MFVYSDKVKRPIKIWLENKEDLEENCLEQAIHLANLPFIHKWVALMPDTHTGKGMPIGGVIATENVIIPNAVGADIGCGMIFTPTNIKISDVKDIMTGNGSLIQAIIGDILRNIPVGVNRHKTKEASDVLDKAVNEMSLYERNTETGAIDCRWLLSDWNLRRWKSFY